MKKSMFLLAFLLVCQSLFAQKLVDIFSNELVVKNIPASKLETINSELNLISDLDPGLLKYYFNYINAELGNNSDEAINLKEIYEQQKAYKVIKRNEFLQKGLNESQSEFSTNFKFVQFKLFLSSLNLPISAEIAQKDIDNLVIDNLSFYYGYKLLNKQTSLVFDENTNYEYLYKIEIDKKISEINTIPKYKSFNEVQQATARIKKNIYLFKDSYQYLGNYKAKKTVVDYYKQLKGFQVTKPKQKVRNPFTIFAAVAVNPLPKQEGTGFNHSGYEYILDNKFNQYSFGLGVSFKLKNKRSAFSHVDFSVNYSFDISSEVTKNSFETYNNIVLLESGSEKIPHIYNGFSDATINTFRFNLTSRVYTNKNDYIRLSIGLSALISFINYELEIEPVFKDLARLNNFESIDVTHTLSKFTPMLSFEYLPFDNISIYSDIYIIELTGNIGIKYSYNL